MGIKWLFPALLIIITLLAAGCSGSTTSLYPPVTATPSAIAPSETITAQPTTTSAIATATSATATTPPSVTTAAASTTPASSFTTLPPVIQEADITVKRMVSTVSVDFLVRADLRVDTAPSNLVYYIDVDPPTTPGQSAFTSNGTYILDTALDSPITWEDVEPGQHVFSAQLVNAKDNTPFSPAIVVKCYLTVDAPGATVPGINRMTLGINILNSGFATATPASVTPTQIQVTCEIHNFKMNDDRMGKMNAPGEGHMIYYLDSEPPTAQGQPANTAMGPGMLYATTNDFQTWSEVDAGRHTFYTQLVNNDNTPLNPPCVGWFIIDIPGQF